ncbi:MAG TPA: ABC transporter ATP-binding protein [Pyrinomonadaceae bacterium]|nr:ABC transporter ATP-binding protein [Pyrinomonadaceae bacterium]
MKKPKIFTSWRAAGDLIWTHRYRLAFGLFLLLLHQLLGLVLPASSKYLIDDVIGRGRGDLLFPLATVVGISTIAQALTAFALSQLLGVTAQRVITDVRKSVQAHVMRLPIRFFDSTQVGMLISRVVHDAEGIRYLVGNGLVQLLGGLATATTAFIVLVVLNWRLTAVTLVALAVFGTMMIWSYSRLGPLYREQSKINAEVTGRLTQSLSGIRVIKTYTAERRESRVFARGTHKLFRSIASSVTGSSGINALTTIAIGCIIILMMVVGGHSVLAGQMTLGGLIMYTFFTILMASPLVQIAVVGSQVTEALAGLERIGEIKRMATEDEGEEAREPLAEMRGEIEFRNVSFEYNAGVPVLKNISFHAPAGSTTALVGSSGSGKSTLISLVMTLNRPLSGQILVDGRDLARLRLRDYRRHLGVVMQDNFLFDGTIADNIGFAFPEATREQILEAGRTAYCDEFIDTFPEGYDTIVGERGIKLSGGQRQRVAIARAILAEPNILILDEATSSLDSESEAMIQQGLRALRRGRTTFVIAHRLSTIESADRILVLEAGEIVESGTHEELLAAGGRYKQLHDKQRRVEHDKFINPGEEFLAAPPEPETVGAANAA